MLFFDLAAAAAAAEAVVAVAAEAEAEAAAETELGKHVVHIRTFGKSSYVDDTFWNVGKFLCHGVSFIIFF